MLCGNGRARVPGRLSSLARRTRCYRRKRSRRRVISRWSRHRTASGPHRRRRQYNTRATYAHM